MANAKIVAVIQARMGSSRLPGKVLMDLSGRPMLWHIVDRLRQCKNLDDIVVATTTEKLDDKIVNFAKKNKVKYYRGSEEDVLKRFIEAGEFFKANYILRVTGDCPLIDPQEIDRLILVGKNNQADFCMGYPEIPAVHVGFELISLKALKKAYQASDLQDYHKEHVTIYVREHPDFVKSVYFKPRKIFQKPDYRLSVDTKADLVFIREIYKRFWDGKEIVDLEKVINFLEINPDIKAINAHVFQKKPKELSKKVAFIIEGGKKLGFGHFARTIQIAKYLVEHKNCGISFIVNNKLIDKKINELGFGSTLVLSENVEKMDLETVCKIVKKEKINSVVIDVKSNRDPSKMIRLLKRESKDVKITLIDNETMGRLLTDNNIYPAPKEIVSHLKWKKYPGKVYSGLDFFPLRDEFVAAKSIKKEKNSIVVTMGASDTNNQTLLVMKSLASSGKKIKVIIGPAFKNEKQIRALASKYEDVFQLFRDPDNYAEVVASASLAITALGISVYEFLYLKIPSLIIGNYKQDLRAGRILEKKEYGKYLGYYKDVKQKDILSSALGLLKRKSKVVSKVTADGVKNIAQVTLSSKKEVVINIAAGKSQLGLIKKLKQMGYEIISVDKDPKAPGFAYSDDKLVISTYEWRKVLNQLRRKEDKYNYLGVVCKSSGRSAITASAIASHYGLAGVKFDVGPKLIFKDKLLNVCQKIGITVPNYLNLKKVCSQDLLSKKSLNFPLVLKPSLALVGKKDVKIIQNIGELKKRFISCKKASLNGVVVVQEYIKGGDTNALVIVNKNKIYLSVLVDEINAFTKDGFTGMGLRAPSRYEEGLAEKRIRRITSKLISKLNITEGFLALSFKVDSQEKPYLIEVNTDLLGNPVMDKLLAEFLPEVDFMEIIIKILTGRKVDRFKGSDIKKKPTVILTQ